MNRLKLIRGEEDFTALQAGERVMISSTPYMLRGRSIDGTELVRLINPGTVHRIRVRGYHILPDSSINPVWYSEKRIQSRRMELIT